MNNYTRCGLALFSALLITATSHADVPLFDDDVNLLRKHFDPVVLERGSQKLLVLGELQARAMSSTTGSKDGHSHGWFNRKILATGKFKAGDALGGAGRLWFGPEAGPYSVFFKPDTPQTVEHLHLPTAMSTQAYTLVDRSETHASFHAKAQITNYHGFTFAFDIDRELTLLDRAATESRLQAPIGKALNFVAYTADTRITNTGKHKWSKDTGLLSIWDLGAFAPSPTNTVIIPVRGRPGKVVRYFSAIEPSHTKITDTHIFYRADAEYMNKIGVKPEHTMPIMAAWDPQRKRLTIVVFSFKPESGVFVSSVWGEANVPYEGDVTNVFNDGPMLDEPPFGPFFELETSSHALELARGQSQSHSHTTMHFEGDVRQLNALCEANLGLSLNDIEAVFK